MKRIGSGGEARKVDGVWVIETDEELQCAKMAVGYPPFPLLVPCIWTDDASSHPFLPARTPRAIKRRPCSGIAQPSRDVRAADSPVVPLLTCLSSRPTLSSGLVGKRISVAWTLILARAVVTILGLPLRGPR